MAKIVYNTCYGGFGLSHAAVMHYARLKELDIVAVEHDDRTTYQLDGEYWSYHDIPRGDPALVRVVEDMGCGAVGPNACLAIRELPPGTRYRIDEYDGSEAVITLDEYHWEVA